MAMDPLAGGATAATPTGIALADDGGMTIRSPQAAMTPKCDTPFWAPISPLSGRDGASETAPDMLIRHRP
ncbi:MAG: hypothetical protein ACT6XY_12030 [Phreatobacter sp.]|uniref:hypothetical protein n=1 Tax=Phreatobacter sp. TaxID=1966341 RepID=UPI0040365BCD